MTAPISSDFNNHELERTGLTKFGETFLANQASKLYQFAQGSVIQGHGFGYLDTFGKVDATKSREVYVQSRMIQVFGLSHYFGDENGKQLVRHGIEVLNSDFHDKNFGGYFNAIDKFGAPAHPEKLAYDQMFVLLAAVMGVALNVPGAKELFEEIDQIIDSKYWDEKFGLMNNSWDSSFMTLDLYRGVNANMHAVEALLAAYDLTKNKKYQDRALRICRAVALDFAKPNLWLLPEHFDANWKVDQEFNINNKADQFRPYGVTIGHLFEWSRLLLQLQISLMNDGIHYDWIEESAVSLYETGKDFGWSADGTAGFIIRWIGRQTQL